MNLLNIKESVLKKRNRIVSLIFCFIFAFCLLIQTGCKSDADNKIEVIRFWHTFTGKQRSIFDLLVDTYNATIGEFLVGIHQKIKSLIIFLENRDMNNYSVYAHSMKSDAYNFGFKKLGDLAYDHEIKSKAFDVYYISEHINDLIRETNEAIVLVQEYMNGSDEEEKVEEERNEYETSGDWRRSGNAKRRIFGKKTVGRSV